MKFVSLFSVLAVLATPAASFAAESAKSTNSDGEVSALFAGIQEKLRAGNRTAEQFSAELAKFEALRSKYASDKEAAAKVVQLHYSFVTQVLNDEAKGRELRALLMGEYRSFVAGTRVEQELEMAERMEKARATQAGLVGKAAPTLTFNWSSEPAWKSLADLKGKVVVVDFWATWCGPCVASFPELREFMERYRESDVVLLGVTSLQGMVVGAQGARNDTRGNAAKEIELTQAFMKTNNMTWPVVFTSQPVFNTDYGVLGIPHIAIVAPDGTVRRNGLDPRLSLAQKFALVDEILKEFGKNPPLTPAR